MTYEEGFTKFPHIEQWCINYHNKNKRGLAYEDFLDYLLTLKTREQQLFFIKVAQYVWDGDEGYGSFPDKETYKGWI